MKIRSITTFSNLSLTEPDVALAQAANFLHNAGPAFAEAGFEVQTLRAASQPFPRILAPTGPGLAVAYAQRLQELAVAYGIDYVSLGPAHVEDDPDYIDAIPDMIENTEALFCAISIADPGRGIDLALLRQTADVIQRVSRLTEDGLSNLFLAALANVLPGAPFFPAAYHEDGAPLRFALALEAADLAVEAFSGAETLDDAQERLTAAVNETSTTLHRVAVSLASEFDVEFGGLDFSLAPFPEDAVSLGGAMERLGAPLGGGGAVAAASVIMTALDHAGFRRAGFSGLMLPVLEDSVLAARAAEGVLSVTDLLLYSAICGTGLDTIPLPGDVSTEALVGILADVAALSLRLDKPLTARLMPLPGKQVGDPTGLEDFAYFAPSRVMAPPAGVDPGGLLMGDGRFFVIPRE